MSLLMIWIKHSLRLFLYSIWLLYSNDLKSLLILDFMLQKSRDSIHCSHSRNPGSRPSTRTFWRVNGFPVSPDSETGTMKFGGSDSPEWPCTFAFYSRLTKSQLLLLPNLFMSIVLVTIISAVIMLGDEGSVERELFLRTLSRP